MTQLLDPRGMFSSDDINVIEFAAFEAKMEAAGMPPLVIHVFHYYYNLLLAGATGYITDDEVSPATALPDYEALDDRYAAAGIGVLDKVVVIKLNGGLGTSMGMDGPKSLVTVKDGLSFLDITVKQILRLRAEHDVRIPLVLMNSFNTRQATEDALAQLDEFEQEIPTGFLQHKVPKVWVKNQRPVDWPQNPEKEWCPPGHGDIYPALVTSGILDKLLDQGYEYAFVSNSDNLGAVLDPQILGYFAEERLPFLMEVANRTLADRKGGHLARRNDGQLILRESAQCPPDEQERFQDINHFRYFNTNNLWIHLPTLRTVLEERNGVLGLPLIRNEKPVDATRPDSPRVFQLETAMGSAIAVFEGAQAMRVPRSRFVPVKKNNDLLALQSDVYRLTPEHHLELNPKRTAGEPRRPPLIELDDDFYGLIDDLQLRFPHGAPSLVECTSLRIEGDVQFGQNVTLVGDVHLRNTGAEPMFIEDGACIEGTHVDGVTSDQAGG